MRLPALLAVALTAPAFAADPPLAKLADGSFPRPWGWSPVLSPDGETLAVRVTVGFDLVNLKTGKVVTIRGKGGRRILEENTRRDAGDTSFAFMPGSTTVITGNHDTEVSVWDAATGKHLRDISMPSRDNPNAIGKLDKFHWGKYLVAVPAKKAVLVFGTGGHLLTADDKFADTKGFYLSSGLCQWSRNGEFLGSQDLQSSVEDWFGVSPLFGPHPGWGASVGFNRYCGGVLPSEDGKLVAASYWGSGDKADPNGVQLWRQDQGKLKEFPLAQAKGVFEFGQRFGFGKGAKVLYAGTNKTVLSWDTATGKRRADVKLAVSDGSIAFDPERERVLSVTKDGIWATELK